MLRLCILDAKTLGSYVDLSVFNKYGQVDVYPLTTPDQVVSRIADCNIIITNKVPLNAGNLSYAPGLKLICLTATGTNNVDLAWTANNGIAVCNVAGYSTKSVAQHTFAMLLFLLENMKYYDTYTQSGEYIKCDTFSHMGRCFHELNGKTYGIVGLGAIGREVAGIAEAFGCRVIYYSTSGKNDTTLYPRVELDTLLSQCDVVSIHAPLNEKTRNLFGLDEMRRMKRDAILLNVGRGGIVDEQALAFALEEGIIGGAGLDVLSVEPMHEDSPFMRMKNRDRLLITPHVGWASFEALDRLMNEVCLNIEAFLNGEKRNRV